MQFKTYVSTYLTLGFLALSSHGYSHAKTHKPHHVSLHALSPIAPDGSALFSYVNHSGYPDSQIFIQVVGVNPKTGAQCFVQYDAQGHPTAVDVHQKMDSSPYALALSSLPTASSGGRSFYLPPLYGSRLYTSISNQLTFLVSKNNLGVWTISAPDPLNPQDPNRNILWDKTEFTIDTGAVFINPTAVDDFSLPIRCQETGIDGSIQAGGLSENRTVIFNALQTTFSKRGAPWTNLISTTPSLVYSPMLAATTGGFPQDFFMTSGWIDAFKQLYSIHPLKIDMAESFPVAEGGGIWDGLIDTTTCVITFTREVDASHPSVNPVLLTLPTNTSELIAGSGPTWNITTALQGALARNLSSAIDTNTLTLTAALGKKYFDSVKASYYQMNPAMPSQLQFIDSYSQVLHSFGNIYTLPYDDELDQSGAASYTPSTFATGSIELGSIH